MVSLLTEIKIVVPMLQNFKNFVKILVSSRADRGLTEIKIVVPMLQNFKNSVKILVSSMAESWTI